MASHGIRQPVSVAPSVGMKAGGGLRGKVRQALEWTLLRRAQALDDEAMRKRAVIVAPHQDDETLGCGGCIALKRRAGAEVCIVFLTDGSRSHPAMEPSRLAQIREGEALRAAAALGVPESCVVFLRFPDTRLTSSQREASAALEAVLRERAPEQIFVPHRLDVYKDHIAANGIGRAAVRAWGGGPEILEYPVWLWRHWPWIKPALSSWKERAAYWARTLQRSAALFGDCRWKVDIREVMDTKRAALAAHESQVSWMGAGWQVLSDVDGGEFLERLTRPVELFSRRRTGER